MERPRSQAAARRSQVRHGPSARRRSLGRTEAAPGHRDECESVKPRQAGGGTAWAGAACVAGEVLAALHRWLTNAAAPQARSAHAIAEARSARWLRARETACGQGSAHRSRSWMVDVVACSVAAPRLLCVCGGPGRVGVGGGKKAGCRRSGGRAGAVPRQQTSLISCSLVVTISCTARRRTRRPVAPCPGNVHASSLGPARGQASAGNRDACLPGRH